MGCAMSGTQFTLRVPTKSLVLHCHCSALQTGLQLFPALFAYIFIYLSEISNWLGLLHIFRLPAKNIILTTTDLTGWFDVFLRALYINGYTVPSNGKITPLLQLLAYEDGTGCSETSAYKIRTSGNYPEESIKHTEQSESLKSRNNTSFFIPNDSFVNLLYWYQLDTQLCIKLVSIKELYYDARPTKSQDLHCKTSRTDIPLQGNH